jgi:hypothetical protein
MGCGCNKKKSDKEKKELISRVKKPVEKKPLPLVALKKKPVAKPSK